MGGNESDMARVKARVEADGSVWQQRPGQPWERVEPRSDWAKVDATMEGEIARQAKVDETEAAAAAACWARRVRRRIGLSQSEFARRIGVPVETVRDWERGRSAPEGAARTLLRLIDRMPEAALAALAA
jgi:putative transcriptional regulator